VERQENSQIETWDQEGELLRLSLSQYHILAGQAGDRQHGGERHEPVVVIGESPNRPLYRLVNACPVPSKKACRRPKRIAA